MPGLLRGMARTAVVAGTATAVSNRVSRRQASRWGAQDSKRVRAGAGTRSPRTRSRPPRLQADPIEQLKQLADLHSQGILTDEEFAAQKAKLLG